MEKKEKETKTLTRAEKREEAKKLIKEILQKGDRKATELIDEASKIFAERFPSEETENINDVKGRIGSLIDVMKKDEEIVLNGGKYALKTEEKPKKRVKKAKVETVETAEEKPKKRARKTVAKKADEEVKKENEEALPLPTAPVLPISPVAPITPEVAPEPIPEDKPKKRTRKAKKTEETPVEIKEEVVVEVKEEQKEEPKEELSPKGTLMDMSFLIGEPKKTAVKPERKAEQKTEMKNEEKPGLDKPKTVKKPTRAMSVKRAIKPLRPMTADEKLQEAFLRKLHRLGGEYFEYYSVYLLEKYSRQNGRRLESLKITAGDKDGGIDGEIELTDRLGFRETIYIQAKNWDPDKGDEKLWTVGETLIQQFIGACVCRQAKDKKQRCRGIFITTSRFTPDAKKMLDEMGDMFVGYDGKDLYDTAKECGFGIVKINGEYALDETLLSGIKAFFQMN